jgi:hypothetical protein
MTTMDETHARDAVDRIVRTWIGTPFHDNAEVKGAGTDCARLIKCVFVEAGLIADYVLPHYSPQHFLHSDRQRFLEEVTARAREIPLDAVKHGDIALYWIGQAFAHGAIVVKPGWPHIVHAHSASRCVVAGRGTAVHLGTPIKGVKYFTLF